MDFKRYVTLISESATNTGYDGFLPSICVAGDSVEMNVLQTELTPTSDEDVAKEWASKFVSDHSIVYLAYRSGERTITVIEIEDTNMTQKQRLTMRPHAF